MDPQRGYAYEPVQEQSYVYESSEHAYLRNPVPEKTAHHTVSSVPENSVNETKAQEHSYFSGWRAGAIFFSTATLLVLAANIGIAVYSIRQYGGKVTADFKPVFTGSCAKTKRLNVGIHLIINILSSILLTGSNFAMQVLTAPTRQQIDDAHARRIWLDIGIPSIRNLRAIRPGKRTLWALILLTSASLHLIYNSIFSQSWTRQAYEAALVTEDFLNGAPFDAGYTEPNPWDTDQRRPFGEIQKNASSYQRLEVMDCVKAYNKRAIIDRKTVLVVTSGSRPQFGEYSIFGMQNSTLNDGSTNPIYATADFIGNAVATSTWDWMCPESDDFTTACDLTNVLNGNEEWTPFAKGVKVDYCLSEYLGEQCTLDFSFGLMAAVCVCNLVKLICMVFLFFKISRMPLLNIGDAVSSFLIKPDFATTGMCLAGKREINRFWSNKGYAQPDTAIAWTSSSLRWFKACSIWRWASFLVLAIISIVLSASLLSKGLRNDRVTDSGNAYGFSGHDEQKLWWQSGFGVANIDQDSRYAITYGHRLYQPQRLVANILLANLPQLVISFLFLMFNSILTVMCMAKEWSDFAHERKPLRVTSPTGKQRSKYFLQLPYLYSIPLLVSSMLLHWLTSQAIFLDRRVVRTVWWNEPYEDNTVGSVSTVGYSPLAVLLCLVFGLLMMIALIALGLRRYKPGIPLAGSCSAAISAACHAPAGNGRDATQPLLWGVVATNQYGVGHCSFSSRDVWYPQPGIRYAGAK